MREDKKIVIWPAYFDSSKTRKQGRKISRKLAVKHPILKEMERSARNLNLQPIVEEEKAYPRSWWETSGRILVGGISPNPKTYIIKEIAKEIKRIRKEVS
jgi:signal recognition particle subunit SRP19